MNKRQPSCSPILSPPTSPQGVLLGWVKPAGPRILVCSQTRLAAPGSPSTCHPVMSYFPPRRACPGLNPACSQEKGERIPRQTHLAPTSPLPPCSMGHPTSPSGPTLPTRNKRCCFCSCQRCPFHLLLNQA